MVVQDSFYKDIHNDLPKIIAEIANTHNLKLQRREDFVLSRTMAGRNPKVRAYRDSTRATEAVLCFSKSPIHGDRQ